MPGNQDLHLATSYLIDNATEYRGKPTSQYRMTVRIIIVETISVQLYSIRSQEPTQSLRKFSDSTAVHSH